MAMSLIIKLGEMKVDDAKKQESTFIMTHTVDLGSDAGFPPDRVFVLRGETYTYSGITRGVAEIGRDGIQTHTVMFFVKAVPFDVTDIATPSIPVPLGEEPFVVDAR
jgi:hypothetical protein